MCVSTAGMFLQINAKRVSSPNMYVLHKPIWNTLKAFVLQLMHFAIKPNSTCVSMAPPPLAAIMGRSWVSKLLIYNLVPMQEAKIKPRYQEKVIPTCSNYSHLLPSSNSGHSFEKFSCCCELLKLLNPSIVVTTAI